MQFNPLRPSHDRKLFVSSVAVAAIVIAATVASAERLLVDRVAALVGDEVITEYEVQQAIGPGLAEINRIDDPQTRLKEFDRRRFEALDELVAEVLVLEEAEKLELPVSDEEVDAHIRRTMQMSGWTEAELLANLRQLGYETLDAYREKTRKEMLKAYAFQIRVGARVNVTEEEVKAEFRERYPNDQQEQVRARHILLRVPELTTANEMAEIYEKAQRIRREITSGELTFEEAARRYSEDTGSASGGGDLGFFTRYLLDERFTAYAFGLDEGELSEVVETPLGVHLIEVTDRRWRDIDSFDREELESFIHQSLTMKARERAYRQWIRELRAGAYIDIRMPSLLDDHPEGLEQLTRD